MDNLKCTINGVEYMARFTYDTYDESTDTYENLDIIETAESVANRAINNIQLPKEPSKDEMLENELLMLTEQNIDLDFRVLMLEFALS